MLSPLNLSLTSFEECSSFYKPIVDSALNHYLHFYLKDNRRFLEEAIRYSVQAGGKRLRPLLTIASFHALNKETPIEAIMPLACAIEMVHTYSLIHDDLPAMDNDDYRRGQPTCHKKWGEDISILAGDTLNTYAFEVLARDLPEFYSEKKVLWAITELARACGINGMAGGQALDLKITENNHTQEYLEKTHLLKTATLIQACVTIPSILEQDPSENRQILSRFGYHIGMLFQIVDDILDVTGEKTTLGKSPNKDMTQKKLTYISLFGLERAKVLAEIQAVRAKEELQKLSSHDTVLLKNMATYFLNRVY